MTVEKSLINIARQVFELPKVTLDAASVSGEQEMVFIDIDSARPDIRDGSEVYRVEGRFRIFANSEKMPIGYIGKQIKKHSKLVKDLFFFGFEDNGLRLRNIVERSVSFHYFYNAQYDPNQGELTSIVFEGE
jgi:hypothetical protein